MILRPICTSGPLWPSGAFKSVTLILIGISLYLILQVSWTKYPCKQDW